jgi:hypothetical protein
MRGSRAVSEDGEGMSPTTLNRLGTFINRVSLYCPPPVILRFCMSDVLGAALSSSNANA